MEIIDKLSVVPKTDVTGFLARNNKKIDLIVEEVVKEYASNRCEAEKVLDSVDLTKIPLEELKKGYFDYRLAPSTYLYGDKLREPCYVKEAVMEIAPPDTVVRKIIQKYCLPSKFVNKVEHFHKIYVYTITAVIGNNDALIEEDMRKMGYFLSVKGDIVRVKKMNYQVLVFEPTSQIQEDITVKVKNTFDVLYHWTPVYRVSQILKEGLKPKSENKKFSFPPRIYFMEGNSSDAQRIYIGRLICAQNDSPLNSGLYSLLSVDIKNLDESVRFFYDPNSEIGIYTEQPIPKERIKVCENVQLRKL